MRRSTLGAALLAAALLVAAAAARGQHDHAGGRPAPGGASPPGVRVTPEELHRAGGVPRGWRFTLPAGDPARGRELFVRLECYQCHRIRGEAFCGDPAEAAPAGPDLTGVGAHHPAEYIAESIVSPNAVIITGPGHVGPDGRSTMPDYGESLTVAELIDLVAYLKSLTAGGEHDDHRPLAVERVHVAGPYRVRLVYLPPAAQGPAAGHAPGAQHRHAHAGRKAAGHLMAFITDAGTGEPVPYLSVTATPRGGEARPPIQLVPVLDDHGFHYGADVTLPAGTRALALSIGAARLRTGGSVVGRYAKPVAVVIDLPEARGR